MKIHALEKTLKEKGFEKNRLDSGYNFTKTVGHILFDCYIEPDIEIEFVVIYQWDNNDVKGIYNISLKRFNLSKDSIETFFRKAKSNMPQHVGESIDTHKEVEEAIRNIYFNT